MRPQRQRLNIAWPAAFLAVALAACGTGDDKPVEANVFPANYKDKILEQIKEQLTDPTNIRDAFIAEPALKTNAGATRYVVCVRFNAKDDFGKYAGSKDKAAFYYAGQMTQIVEASRELCGNAAYQPFPELQKLCREAVCKT